MMFGLTLSQTPGYSLIHADFPNEPEIRRQLLSDLLLDMYGQEDLYLSEIAKAEAGETILDLYNNWVYMELYPDGRVVIEELRFNEEDEAVRGEPDRTEITLAEAKQLILDWLDAKAKWRAEHGPLNDGTK